MGKLVILHGNIVDDDILKLGDTIVLPTNPMMRCGAGVSGAVFKKAGVDQNTIQKKPLESVTTI